MISSFKLYGLKEWFCRGRVQSNMAKRGRVQAQDGKPTPWYSWNAWNHGPWAPWWHAWHHGTLTPWWHPARWHLDTMKAPCLHGTLAPWNSGSMAPWHHITMEAWHYGPMAPWHHSTLALWQPGTMTSDTNIISWSSFTLSIQNDKDILAHIWRIMPTSYQLSTSGMPSLTRKYYGVNKQVDELATAFRQVKLRNGSRNGTIGPWHHTWHHGPLPCTMIR